MDCVVLGNRVFLAQISPLKEAGVDCKAEVVLPVENWKCRNSPSNSEDPKLVFVDIENINIIMKLGEK